MCNLCWATATASELSHCSVADPFNGFNWILSTLSPVLQLSQLLALSQLGHHQTTKMTAQLSTDKSSDIQYGTVTLEDTDAILTMLKSSFFKV